MQMGTYSEFRGDSEGALRNYQAAHQHVSRVLQLRGSSAYGMRPQAVVSVLSCAEQVHFKILMLQFHLHRPALAMEQYRQHIAAFASLPRDAPVPLRAWHMGWLSRQHCVCGDLLSLSLTADPPRPGAPRLPQPGGLFLEAAAAAAARRQAAEQIQAVASAHRPAPPVSPGPLVGSLVHGSTGTVLSEEDFLGHLEAEELQVAHSRQCLELLTRAHEIFRSLRQPHQVMRTRVLMADEYLALGDATAAKKCLDAAAHEYRREGWQGLLGPVLLQLRECAQRLSQVREHVALSLEISCLHSGVDRAQQAAVAETALAALCAEGGSGASSGLRFDIEGESGLARCITCLAGFSHPSTWTPGQPLQLGVAIRSGIPRPLPIRRLRLEVRVEGQEETQVHETQLEAGRTLPVGEWLVLQYPVDLGPQLTAAAQVVTLDLGPQASFSWRPSAFGGFHGAGEAAAMSEHPFPSHLRVQPGLASVVPALLRLPVTASIEAGWQGPMLQQEALPITARLEVGAAPLPAGRFILDVKQYHLGGDTIEPVMQVELGSGEPWLGTREISGAAAGTSWELPLVLRARQPGRALVRAGYVLTKPDGRLHVVSSTSLEVRVVSPLSVVSHAVTVPSPVYYLLPASMGISNCLPVGRPCHLDLGLCANANLTIRHWELSPGEGASIKPLLLADSGPVDMDLGDVHNSVLQVQVPQQAANVPLGTLHVTVSCREVLQSEGGASGVA